MALSLQVATLSMSSISRAVGAGWRMFLATRSVSVTYALSFAVFGLVSLFAVAHLGTAPMALPMAGGFMLVGPILLVGYFRIADLHMTHRSARLGDAFGAFRAAPRGLWALAAVAMLFYLIWMTDAATLYGFMVGKLPAPMAALAVQQNVANFVFWSSLMGAALAFIIFSTTAFAVPLLYYRRASLVVAVIASVQAVFGNFLITVAWAILLAVSVIGSILLLPLFLVIFPLFAYASHALYCELFPENGASSR